MKLALTASITLVVLASAMFGSVTFAYFSDIETSTGNTFTAGTLDLKVSDSDEVVFKDGVMATWTFSARAQPVNYKLNSILSPFFKLISKDVEK